MKQVTKATRQKMSAAAKRRCTPEWRKAKSDAYATPLPLDELTRLYRGGTTQNELAVHFGVTQKAVWGFMRRNKVKARKAAKRNQTGEANDSWKGDLAGYKAMHLRMTKRFGQPKRCDQCGTTDKRKAYSWASLTRKYHDMNDYRRMCRSCHARYDGTIANIKHMRERMVARG